MTKMKFTVLKQAHRGTPPEVLQMFEEALEAAKAGNVTWAVIAYGIVGQESPVMRHGGTTGSLDNAKSAVLACSALHLGLLQKHLLIDQ